MWVGWLITWILLLAPKAFAVSVTILDSPASVASEPFPVTVKVTSGSSGTNYLRIDLFLATTKNYFGETDNGSYWYAGSSGTEYLPVELVKDTPLVATVSARLGEPTSAYYPGPGEYLLRVRRYTSSGNQGSETPSPVPITLTHSPPTPPPTGGPTPTPPPTGGPTPTPPPSASPRLTPTPPPTPLAPSAVPTPSLITSLEGTVAGLTLDSIHLETLSSPTPSPPPPPPAPAKPRINRRRARIAILIGTGLLLLSLAGYLGYRKHLAPKQV